MEAKIKTFTFAFHSLCIIPRFTGSALSSSCPGSQTAGLLTFIVVNSFFAILDLTGRPEWLVKYKIQDEKTLPVSCMAVQFLIRRLFGPFSPVFVQSSFIFFAGQLACVLEDATEEPVQCDGDQLCFLCHDIPTWKMEGCGVWLRRLPHVPLSHLGSAGLCRGGGDWVLLLSQVIGFTVKMSV